MLAQRHEDATRKSTRKEIFKNQGKILKISFVPFPSKQINEPSLLCSDRCKLRSRYIGAL